MLAQLHGKHVPLVIKIVPDMSDEQAVSIARALVESGMDAVIASNTSLSRGGLEGLAYGDEPGGMSGAPLRDKSTHILRILANERKRSWNTPSELQH